MGVNTLWTSLLKIICLVHSFHERFYMLQHHFGQLLHFCASFLSKTFTPLHYFTRLKIIFFRFISEPLEFSSRSFLTNTMCFCCLFHGELRMAPIQRKTSDIIWISILLPSFPFYLMCVHFVVCADSLTSSTDCDGRIGRRLSTRKRRRSCSWVLAVLLLTWHISSKVSSVFTLLAQNWSTALISIPHVYEQDDKHASLSWTIGKAMAAQVPR